MDFRKNLFLFIFLLLLLSCADKHSHNSNDKIVSVNVDTKQQSSLSEFFSNERYIILENNDSCLISRVDRCCKYGNSIFIQDGFNIFIFDASGKFINTFNQHGPGPGEYTEINSLRIFDGEIFILDSNKKKIIKYSTTGDFLQGISLDYAYIDFFIKSKDKIVLASGNVNDSMSEFVIINSQNGNILSKICNYGIASSVIMWDYLPFCGKKDEDIYVNIPFSHYTYKLEDVCLDTIAYYKFNTLVQLPKTNLSDLNIFNLTNSTQNTNVVRQLGYYYPTENFAYMSFFLFGKYGIKNHIIKFNTKGNCLAQKVIGVDFDSCYPYISDIRGIDNGDVICVSDADRLLRIDQSLHTSFWTEQGLTEDSNPVVFFYTLKE